MFEGLFQPMHLIILLVILLVIFGPSKLGDIGAALGRSVREFKQTVNDGDETRSGDTPAAKKS